MALVLVLKSVERLPGKADRMAKATFRGKSLIKGGSIQFWSILSSQRNGVDATESSVSVCSFVYLSSLIVPYYILTPACTNNKPLF